MSEASLPVDCSEVCPPVGPIALDHGSANDPAPQGITTVTLLNLPDPGTTAWNVVSNTDLTCQKTGKYYVHISMSITGGNVGGTSRASADRTGSVTAQFADSGTFNIINLSGQKSGGYAVMQGIADFVLGDVIRVTAFASNVAGAFVDGRTVTVIELVDSFSVVSSNGSGGSGLLGVLKAVQSGSTVIPNSQFPPLVIIPLVTVPNDEGVGITHNVGPGTITLDADTWFDIDFGVTVGSFVGGLNDFESFLWNDTLNLELRRGGRFEPTTLLGNSRSIASIKYKTGPIPETISLRAFQISGAVRNASSGYIDVCNLGIVGVPSNGGTGPFMDEWRIAVESVQNETLVHLAEVEFRDAVGGTDLVGAGSPEASSNFDLNNRELHAVDGDSATGWASIRFQENQSWWRYKFGDPTPTPVPTDVQEVAITSLNAGPAGTGANRGPRNFRIEKTSDGVIFDLWSNQKGIVWAGNNETKLFLETPFNRFLPHRYWRVMNELIFANQVDLPQFAEIELRATVGGPNQTGGAIISASSELAGFEAVNAFDGNPATSWTTIVTAGAGSWIKVDAGVGNSFSVMEMLLQAPSVNQGTAAAPRALRLEYADDDSSEDNWVSWRAFLGLSWSLSEIKLFT